MSKNKNYKILWRGILYAALLFFCIPLHINAAAENKISSISFKASGGYTPLSIESSKKLKVNFLPSTARNKKLTWTSSNPAIVSVKSNGTITGISLGKATITAKTTDGSDLSISREVRVYQITQTNARFIAHRGFSSMAPENTIPAFSLAGDFGFWGSECDVWEAKNDNLYIMHDFSLQRMCGVDKPIIEVRKNELKLYSIISGNNLKTYPHETIPTFEEYLKLFLKYPYLHPVIELKNNLSEKSLKKLIFLLEFYQLTDTAYIISPFRMNLISLRTDYSDLNLQYVATKPTKSDIDFCIQNSLDLSCYYENLTVKQVKKLHENGCKVSIWTVDSKDLAYKYIDKYKVDYITTNQCLFGQ